MYSPFFDKKGQPLSIDKIKYGHLSQLVECDEGHHVEYKLLLEDGGRAQLAKEITSFANCEGGWLIIGIDDKTKKIQPIDKQDYSQRIGKIATRISPMPEFSTRFLASPDNKRTGVLVVYVYEGKNAPYICNGSVYVRSGSSKEPIKPADRGNIEYLYERSKEYQKNIDNFCKRDFYYAYNNILQCKVTYPIANIYLKNVSSKYRNFFNLYTNRDKFIDFIKLNNDIFEHISYSMNSIIFMHKFIFPGSNSGTFVFEFFTIGHVGEVVPFFYGNQYQEYVKRHGIPYAHRENNKSKIIYLKDNPKVHFDEMSGSLIADVLGAAFGFRSDSVFEILQDSNKHYIE